MKEIFLVFIFLTHWMSINAQKQISWKYKIYAENIAGNSGVIGK